MSLKLIILRNKRSGVKIALWCEQKEQKIKELIEEGKALTLEGLTGVKLTFLNQLSVVVGQYHRVDAGEIRVESFLDLLAQDCEKYKDFVVWSLLLERATVNRWHNSLTAQKVIRLSQGYQTETIEF
jgi:hypothetical protein